MAVRHPSVLMLMLAAVLACPCAVAASEDLAQFRRFREEQFQAIQPAFDAVAARYHGITEWQDFSARLQIIDEVTAALLGAFSSAKSASLDAILAQVVAVSPGPSASASAPANPRSILERYEQSFRQPLPSVPSATDEELGVLRAYYNLYATVASRFIAERGQMFAGLDRRPTADIVELCLVVPFLHVADEAWTMEQAKQLPAWLQTSKFLPVCENFALVIGRFHGAWTFSCMTRQINSPTGMDKDFVGYLIDQGRYRHHSKDHATAYRCLKQAIALLDPAKDLPRLNDLRFTLAELVSLTGHSQIAADEMKRVLESSPDALQRGRSAVLRLKYLYEAQKFEAIIIEAPGYLTNPDMAPYEPQLLYIAWVANRRENENEEADKLKTKFIASYPDHVLAADLYFADAMTALTASSYDEAKRLLEIVQFRFPQSRLVTKASEISERLATVEAEKK